MSEEIMNTSDMILSLGREEQFWKEVGSAKKMVLSTCADNRVTSRMVSLVIDNGIFYFQTDIKSLKAEQIMENANVSLCIDNIQIEGVCTLQGDTECCPRFLELMKEHHHSTYERYSLLEDEVCYAVRPTRVERWFYDDDGTPFIVRMDFETHEFTFEKYEG